jgi:1-deoxy-D-xylulose-5-phosphate synthase
MVPQGLFGDLGIKSVGPIDGHDLRHLEHALRHAKDFGAPVIVHVLTEKGRGYHPAENHVEDKLHAVGRIHPETGLPIEPSRFGWMAVFAEEIVTAARARKDIVAITAAMQAPVGLQPLATEMSERVIDLGIAEQHAATVDEGSIANPINVLANDTDPDPGDTRRSEERRVGTECMRPCRSRWAPYH